MQLIENKIAITEKRKEVTIKASKILSGAVKIFLLPHCEGTTRGLAGYILENERVPNQKECGKPRKN